MADNKEAPTGAVVKRSFDIAFLTGTVERLPEEPVIKKEETPEEPPQSYQPKSAFQKVGSGQPTITGNSSAPKDVKIHIHEESKDQSNEVQAKCERKMLSPHMTSFPSNKSYHPPHRMNTKHKNDANLPIDGIMHFPALRRLLDVRNSIQSLEEDPTLEDAVEAVEAETSAAAAGGPGSRLSPGSATAMASLLSSPLLFPLTPGGAGGSGVEGGSGILGGGGGLGKDMTASLAALLLPSPNAASLSGIVPSNTCAICGVTFRMTSDLVYHMRTHHAKNAAESSYEKRHKGDKLTCGVCGEHFRERHHLTRHMTAHQARKGEPQEGEAKKVTTPIPIATNPNST